LSTQVATARTPTAIGSNALKEHVLHKFAGAFQKT
jgi:hypothetical protein